MRLTPPAHLKRLLLTAAMAPTGLMALPSYSQPMLEEVMVTAQKRTESLQDVPISVATMGQEELEMRVIDDLKDIGSSIPNLYINPFNTDPTAIRLFIRGIGQNDVQITQDPSVALYTDGIYIGTSVGAGFEGVDIERLEVLRGPQGTLYGRNATGGAVNIVTRRATTESLQFRQDLTTGNLGKFSSKTVVNVPFGDQLAAKLSYVTSERDGYVDNKGPGQDFGQEDRESIVADLHWDANENLTVDFRYEHAENNDTQRLEQITDLFLLDDGSVGGVFGSSIEFRDVSEDFLDEATSFRKIEKNDQTIDAYSLWGDWAISDNFNLRSITSYRELDSLTSGDSLATAEITLGTNIGAPVIGRFTTDYEQMSQEFQLLGGTEHWEYVAGIYYFRDKATQDAYTSTQLAVTDQVDLTETKNESIAAYAQGTWTPDFMDKRWQVTLGARYSWDDRKADRSNERAVIPFSGSYKNDFDNFNPSLTVAFDLNQDMNVYGKVVSGYKSGGTSTRSANAELFEGGFEEEDILSYELGFKGDLWDSRARLNAAAFYMELDGLQSSVQTDPISPGGRDFLPIDNNEIFGFEVDITVLVTESLTATASYGYLDTELGESTLDSGTAAGSFDLIDSFAPAPENSYSLALNYVRPLAIGELGVNVNYSWQDDVYTSINQNDVTVIDDNALLGAAISWSDIQVGNIPGSFRVLAWGRNLTDEEYGLVSIAAFRDFFGVAKVQTFGDPRTYGVTLTYQYE